MSLKNRLYVQSVVVDEQSGVLTDCRVVFFSFKMKYYNFKLFPFWRWLSCACISSTAPSECVHVATRSIPCIVRIIINIEMAWKLREKCGNRRPTSHDCLWWLARAMIAITWRTRKSRLSISVNEIMAGIIGSVRAVRPNELALSLTFP